MTFRNTPRNLLRQAASADLRALGRDARDAMAGQARRATSPAARHALAHGARTHGTRLTASKPARYTAGIAATATIATLAATAATGPASAATTPAQAPATSTTHQAPASHDTSGTSSQGTSSASGPTTIYDSTSPSSIPAGQHAAVYADGAYQASTTSVQGHGNVLWIDTNGTDTHASALDVEPGDATPASAAQWVNAKLTATPHTDAIVYTFKSDWTAVQDSINTLPAWEQSHVKYWIADPTGTPHIVPGAAATQWYWGPSYDITQATPGFFS
jgi:hypothetical protein